MLALGLYIIDFTNNLPKNNGIQPDQINMAMLFWYLVKSDAIVYAKSHFTRCHV